MSLVSDCVKQFQNKCNFSIDHILNVAGEKNKVENFNVPDDLDEDKKFEWLRCTRYRPPKLQRQRKKEGIQRRNLGRNPRIPFSSSQVAFLEAKFIRTPYLSSSDVTQLAVNLNLSETRVKIWFQNRRARERRDRETKTKSSESGKDGIVVRGVSTSSNDCYGLENLFVEPCIVARASGDGHRCEGLEDRHRRLRHDRGEIDFCDAIPSGVRFRDVNSYVQLFRPLDLSERQLLCN